MFCFLFILIDFLSDSSLSSVSYLLKIISQEPQFFNLVIPYRYYEKLPPSGVYVYNFSEKPFYYQPSGTFNIPVEIEVPSKNKTSRTYKFLPVTKFRMGFTLNGEGEGEKVFKMLAITYNVLIINDTDKSDNPNLKNKENDTQYITRSIGTGQTKLLFG